jgi:3-oxoacyl-(acyl-carrier-protein) synthase
MSSGAASAARTREIAIVGTGILTAAGRGHENTLSALASGGRDPAPPQTIGGDLAGGPPVFEVAEAAFSRFEGRLPGGRGRRSLRLALVAATDAVRDAASAGFAPLSPERVGVVVGATVGGMNHSEEWIADCCDPAPAHRSRRALAARPAMRHLPLHEIPHALAARFGFTGPAFAVATACTSGAQAIATAGDLIATGVCDFVLAGGVDCLSRLTYHGFATLGVMSQRRCAPFDASRMGLNLGEGSAFVVLARADSLPSSPRLPRLAGWGSNTDAHHMTAPRPDGSGVAAAIREALGSAGVAPRDVDWVHAHGTATPTNDGVESTGIRAAFGSHRVAVSSTKHVFGHTLGAAGSISAVVTVVALRAGFVPGNAPILARDPACDVDVVPPSGVDAGIRHAVVSSLGFGGSNCALLVSGGRA